MPVKRSNPVGKEKIVANKEELFTVLKPILHDKGKLKAYLEKNSSLPGPRSNLELAFAFAAVCDDRALLLEWTAIPEKDAGVNDPRSFPAFCSVVALGKLFTTTGDTTLLGVVKNAARDGRWRMREAAAFALQIIGEHDFTVLQHICSEWIDNADNLEKRAILVALAHPPILNKTNTAFCFKVTDRIVKTLVEDDDFEVLKKGLEFTISVFAAADPQAGFRFIEKWIGKSVKIDRIMKANLKKNRLVKKDPQEVKRLLGKLS